MKKSEKPIYAPVPARAMGDQRLTALDLRVLMVLAYHDRLGANGAGCYASHPRLAALVGCHVKSLSRSLAILAGRDEEGKEREAYISAEKHPLNGKLRVYRVRYTEFDRLYAEKGIGSPPVTNGKVIGNEFVDDDGVIGNTNTPPLVTDSNGVPYTDQRVSHVNILSEALIHPVETVRIHPAEAAPRGTAASEASVAAMLAMLERTIKAGKVVDPQRWIEWLEEQHASLSPGDMNYGQTIRMIEQYGDDLASWHNGKG